jgi:hypothetical protein
MIIRKCRDCGAEMIKELTPDGVGFFCKECDGHCHYDEFDMEPRCPECGDELEFCYKCGQAFFCNTCNGLVSRKKIIWKEK